MTEDVNSWGWLWQEKHATNPNFNLINRFLGNLDGAERVAQGARGG